MAGTSLAQGKADLFGLLTTDAIGTPVSALASIVDVVFDHEPKPDAMPRACVVTVSTDGVTPDFFRYALRIYQHPDVDARDAQQVIDSAVLAIDGLITDEFGPSEWTVDFDDDIDQFVAENLIEVGREDCY